jgi:hypothetical protein
MKKENKLQIRNSTAEFLIFTRQAGEDGIEVRVEDETVWLTQKLISVLFDKGRSTITEHLKNIFDTGELDEESGCRDFRHTDEDSKDCVTKFYYLGKSRDPGLIARWGIICTPIEMMATDATPVGSFPVGVNYLKTPDSSTGQSGNY